MSWKVIVIFFLIFNNVEIMICIQKFFLSFLILPIFHIIRGHLEDLKLHAKPTIMN